MEGAGATVQTLAAIGITSQKDGTLAVDATKLDAALSSDFDGVARLFGTAETGVAAKLYSQVTDRLADGGAIDTRSKSLQDEQKRAGKRSPTTSTFAWPIVQKTYLSAVHASGHVAVESVGDFLRTCRSRSIRCRAGRRIELNARGNTESRQLK